MKSAICKRCNAGGLYWTQSVSYSDSTDEEKTTWTLRDTRGDRHFCESDTIKMVKCKYCQACDLHWAEELNPNGQKRMVLTESYGLPHVCDEQREFRAKAQQEKKDKYQVIKGFVTSAPEGTCTHCNGQGRIGNVDLWNRPVCIHCKGWGRFDFKTRKSILASARLAIWPRPPSEDVPF